MKKIFMLSIILVFSSLLFACSDSHPRDRELEATFRDHEADFQRLVSMSNVDSRVIRIAPTFTRLDDNYAWPRADSELGFSKERWDEYRKIFSSLKLAEGLERPEDKPEVIFMIASSQGLSFGGSMKGYAYSPKDLSPVLNSLENIPNSSLNGQPVYKRINAHWYLFYWSF
jgi:hypothetical protein